MIVFNFSFLQLNAKYKKTLAPFQNEIYMFPLA